MKNLTLAALVWFSLGLIANTATASEPSSSLRIGAVAYAPSTVTVFQQLTQYLRSHGLESDFVLYSNYDALVAALNNNEVDVAWNTPLAHGKFHVQNQCSSQALVMRDVDFGVRSVLVARSDAEIETPAQLEGKRLILGSSYSAEAVVLPKHFLSKTGVDLSMVTIVSLDGEFDSAGNPCSSPRHVFEALRNGRGDAGVVTEAFWNRINQDNKLPSFKPVWTSPSFNHCVFTASVDLDRERCERFTELMVKMDPADEATAEIMRLEGTKEWRRGSQDGFESLVQALGGDTR